MHDHCGESGAIGAALEASRLYNNGKKTTFIGLDEIKNISYKSTTNEDTRCYFCKNKCLRTFIDVNVDASQLKGENSKQKINKTEDVRFKSKVPLDIGSKRLIVGNSCEKGLVEDVNDMRVIKKSLDSKLEASPNLVEQSAKEVFKSFTSELVADEIPK